jgi:sterol desaturase/sphingolipid hydroxylase (fatty acid hydroxylase superfamily)
MDDGLIPTTFFGEFVTAFKEHAFNTLVYPFDPAHRIYVLYLATSIILAFYVYLRTQKNPAEKQEGETSFLRFLFPRHVWSNPSAWLDIRYFFFHQLIGKFLILGLFSWMAVEVFWYVSGTDYTTAKANIVELGIVWNLSLAILYMFVTLMVVDFIAYILHYLQHKVPLLWQFHKVHHSLEVMHPISNFREHPVDNLVYNLFTGVGYGLITGLTYRTLGYLPNMPTLIGVPLIMFGFNAVGYNLRHSHVWLRWPGRLSMVFPSPAHHHVHHSYHPDHIDKNFAFLFPIWDVIFKTYTLPEDNRDVRFGLGNDQGKELTSCLKLYYIPVRDAFRLFRKRSAPEKALTPTAEAPPSE